MTLELPPRLPLSETPGPTGRIRRAHLSLQRYADALFGPRKITTDQCSLLWILRRREGIRQNELAAELYTDPNTVTAMVVRLEKRGLIYREVCSDDARARRVYLTPQGKRLVHTLSEDWEPMRRKLRELFAGEGGADALRILTEACEVMTQSRDEILAKQSALRKRSVRTKRRVVSRAPAQTGMRTA